MSLAALAVAAACPLAFFPVRGRHETGYQASPSSGDESVWTCDAALSNSDFFRRGTCDGHLGNDIWAREGTPVVAAVSGRIVQAEFSAYAGNQVRILDDCGWSHYTIHLQAIAPGIAVGDRIEAGTLIGWVGRTGTASNGVVHLHYCGNRVPAPVRGARSPSAPAVNTLRTSYSWFICFGFGEHHHGGNTTWYFTLGDDNQTWGWVAAGDLLTSSDFDADPAAHGLPACRP